jgi:very-short-patch-repair endonuclease
VGVEGSSRFDRTLIKTTLARRLRRNTTDVERGLWHRLRNAQIDGARRAPNADRQWDEWLRRRGVTVLRFWNSDLTSNLSGMLEVIAGKAAELKSQGLTPIRRWRADLPLSGGGAPNARRR